MVRQCPSQPETYSTLPDHVTPSTRVSRRPTRDPSPPPVSSTVRCRLVKTHLSLSLAPRPRPKTSLHRYSSINTPPSVNSVRSPCLTARAVRPPRVAVSEFRPSSHTVILWARSMMMKCLTSEQCRDSPCRHMTTPTRRMRNQGAGSSGWILISVQVAMLIIIVKLCFHAKSSTSTKLCATQATADSIKLTRTTSRDCRLL